MSYRKLRPKKELEIVSLIDVVFLLIIFGLVISVSGFPGEDYRPMTKTFTIVISRVVTRNSQGELEVRRSVTFRDPDRPGASDSTYYFPKDDSLSTSVINRSDWKELDACKEIRRRIAEFAEPIMDDGQASCVHAILDVEVTPDTRTRIVNYILEQCAPLQCRIGRVRVAVK